MSRSNKRKKMIVAIIFVALALIAATVIFLHYLYGQIQGSTTTSSDVQSSQVEVGTISTTVEGTGNIAATDASAVKIPKGLVIHEIKVQNGQAVKIGDPIATVTKASAANELLTMRENIESIEEDIENLSDDVSDTSTTEYLRKVVLESELEELKTNRDVLEDILASETIVAPYAGTIADLNLTVGSSVEDSSQNTTDNSNSSSNNNSSNTSSNMMRNISYTNLNQNTFSLLPTAPSTSAQKQSTNTMASIAYEETEAPFTTSTLDSENENDDEPSPSEAPPVSITQLSELQITPPKTGATPQTNLSIIGDVPANYTGSVTWNNTDPTFNADTTYTATIVLTANKGYSFANDILVEIQNTLLINWQVFDDGSENRLRIVAVFEKTFVPQADSGEKAQDSPSTPEETNPANGNSPSAPSASDSSGDGSNSSTTSGITTSDSLLTTIATISSSSKARVNINVDELDILTIEEGQKADVTLDALENETFVGTVTTISSEASSGSDSVKYSVTVELDKTDEMLIGMSAASTIKIKEANDVLTIPINALQETGDTVFVYTYADANGNLSSPIEIKTGLSDGTNVEVLEGLSETDIVYYIRTISENADNQFTGGGMIIGGGPMPGGMGNRPQGATMIPIQ